MKGFGIYVKNDLLEPKHVKAMGGDRNCGALWLYLWLLDKMTVIDHDKGEGKVLGDKPIKHEDIKNDLGISRMTYSRWINILRDNNYIQTKRTPYGLIIIVNKAQKIFNNKEKKRSNLNVTSKGSLELHHSAVGVTSNKTIQLDNTDKKKLYKEKKDHRGEYSPAKEKLRERWT